MHRTTAINNICCKRVIYYLIICREFSCESSNFGFGDVIKVWESRLFAAVDDKKNNPGILESEANPSDYGLSADVKTVTRRLVAK